MAFLAARAPEAYERLAERPRNRAATGLPERIEELGQPRRLSELGGDASKLGEAIEAMLRRPELQRVPRPPTGRSCDAAGRPRLVVRSYLFLGGVDLSLSEVQER